MTLFRQLSILTTLRLVLRTFFLDNLTQIKSDYASFVSICKMCIEPPNFHILLRKMWHAQNFPQQKVDENHCQHLAMHFDYRNLRLPLQMFCSAFPSILHCMKRQKRCHCESKAFIDIRTDEHQNHRIDRLKFKQMNVRTTIGKSIHTFVCMLCLSFAYAHTHTTPKSYVRCALQVMWFCFVVVDVVVVIVYSKRISESAAAAAALYVRYFCSPRFKAQ